MGFLCIKAHVFPSFIFYWSRTSGVEDSLEAFIITFTNSYGVCLGSRLR